MPASVRPRSLVWFAILVLVQANFVANAAYAQSDQLMAPVGNTDAGTAFRVRCPQGSVLYALQLRAGDVIDQVQPACGKPSSPTRLSDTTQMLGAFGGGGGASAMDICPEDHPVVIGAALDAEGVDAPVLEAIMLYCGLATSSPQTQPARPLSWYLSPIQTQLASPGLPKPTTAPPTHVDASELVNRSPHAVVRVSHED